MKRNFKQFLHYTTASMLGMMIGGSFSIVDTIFLGRGVGEIGLAAVALTWPLVITISAFGDAFGMGAAVLISQAHGAGEATRAKRIFNDMFFLTILTALIISGTALISLKWILLLFGVTMELMPDALTYATIMLGGSFASMFMLECVAIVRNDGHPMLSTGLVVIGLLGNAFLDWLFIMYFRWGAAGAAYATIASQTLAVLCGMIYFLSPQTTLKINIHSIIPHWKSIKDICVTGFPIFGNTFSIVAMLFLHNIQALHYAHEAGLAAYTMVAGLESLGSMLMFGLAEGIQPLVSYMHGAKKYKRQNLFGNYGYRAAFGLGIVLMLFSFALRDSMPNWVGLSGNVAKLAAHGILISSTAFLLLGVIRVAGVYYQSTGKIFDSSLLIYGDSFFALPLCLFTLPLYLGMDGVWWAMPVSRVILFVILCWLWFGKHR